MGFLKLHAPKPGRSPPISTPEPPSFFTALLGPGWNWRGIIKHHCLFLVSQSLLNTWSECGREDLWNVLMAQWTACVWVSWGISESSAILETLSSWGCSLKTQIWKSFKPVRQISKHSMYLKINYKFQLEIWYTFSNNSKIIAWKLH